MIIIALLVLVLIAGSSLFLYNQSRSILEETIFDNAERQAENNEKIVTNWLQGVENQINDLSKTPVVKNMNWYQQKNLLTDISQKYDYFDGLLVADKNGDFNITNGSAGNISDRNYFQKAMSSGEEVISETMVSKATGEQIIAVGSPIFENNNIVGFLGATISLNYLQELVKDMNISGYGYGWLIDSNKKTVAHPEEKYLGNKSVFDDANQQLMDIADKMAAGKKGVHKYVLNGVEKYLAYAPINLTGWSVAVAADSKDVLSPLKVIRNSSFIIGIIAIVIGLVIAFFIAMYIANPIKIATKQAELIADGDLTSEIPEKLLNRKDEIGVLAKSFSIMISNLKNMIGKVADTSSNLSASSEELSASSEEIAASAEQVGNAIQEVASGAEEQSAQVEETTANIHDLINQIGNVGNMSGEMNEQADFVMNNIEGGNKSIANSVEQINNVKDNSNEVSLTIDNLGSLSNRIGEIVELINGIAAQTNLLALNAAIEAARAGEAGRGFSVVADEIRELAEESSSATEEIGGLIKDIQNGVTNAIDKMNNTEEVVDESVGAIEDTGNSFGEINNAAKNLRKLIEKIGKQAEDMTGNSNKVEEAIMQIAAVSQESASNSEEVAASSEEQGASTEEIVTAATELAEMANQLTNAVNKFKL